ncbi:hypothetical protein [Bacillus sp. REN10]|uniref:hypothetical protein n=1 Tax=Bacillus sp. REN10 TaxID=2782541 RepID=UPI00193B4107|nr:hypothetical protein [Bacillus sp. REN10]
MNGSESMLTYRKEDGGSPLVAGACSWTKKCGADCPDTTSKCSVAGKAMSLANDRLFDSSV